MKYRPNIIVGFGEEVDLPLTYDFNLVPSVNHGWSRVIGPLILPTLLVPMREMSQQVLFLVM